MLASMILLASSLLSSPPDDPGAVQPPESTGCQAIVGAHDGKADAAGLLDLVVGASTPEGSRRVRVTVDRVALLARLQTLQDHGVISTGLPRSELDRHPATAINRLSLSLMPCAIRGLYSTEPGLDRTRWTVSLRDVSDSASQRRQELYSFDFNQVLYERTLWQQVGFANFPNVATGFSYNLRFTLDMSRETSGGIDDD